MDLLKLILNIQKKIYLLIGPEVSMIVACSMFLFLLANLLRRFFLANEDTSTTILNYKQPGQALPTKPEPKEAEKPSEQRRKQVPPKQKVQETPIAEPTKEPVAEEPVAEEPVAEEPVAEEPVAEEPVAEPVAEEPAAEEVKPSKKNKRKKKKSKEKTKKLKKSEEPAKEEPVKEEPVAEEPVKEEPVAEEPVKEEPIKEEPVAEEPVAEEPVAEERPSKAEEEAARKERHKKLQDKRAVHVSEMAPVEEDAVEPRTLREGLASTRKGWVSRLGELLRGKKELDDDVLDELEEVLFTADIGTRTTSHLLQIIEEKMERNELADPEKVKEAIKDEIYKILTFDAEPLNFEKEQPYVVMVVGVNGVGKTTTIGKLSARLSLQGKKVVVAAADTFRAAAVEQLEHWASKVDAEVIKGQPNQDPSSVVFDAVQAGAARGADVILADTAGRLHTKQNLMEELKKIKRVMGRAHSSAPHEVILVVDATTGQNAVTQAKQFNEALGLTGIVLTKLDGTAKGGVVVAIAEELKIPIRYIGVGEHIDELRAFSPSEFVEALFQS